MFDDGLSTTRPLAPFQYKGHISTYRDSHHKDMTAYKDSHYKIRRCSDRLFFIICQSLVCTGNRNRSLWKARTRLSWIVNTIVVEGLTGKESVRSQWEARNSKADISTIKRCCLLRFCMIIHYMILQVGSAWCDTKWIKLLHNTTTWQSIEANFKFPLKKKAISFVSNMLVSIMMAYHAAMAY